MTLHAGAPGEVRLQFGVADQTEATRLRQRVDPNFLVTCVAPRVHAARMIGCDRLVAQAALAVGHMRPVTAGAGGADVQRTDRHPIRARPDVAVDTVERHTGFPRGTDVRHVIER